MLRIANFNVENFNSPGLGFVGRPGDPLYDATTFAEKCRFVTSILDEADADIVGVQEVFSANALKQCVEASARMRGATIAVPGDGLATENGIQVAMGPNVGLISRLPVESVEEVSDFPPSTTLLVPTGRHEAIDQVVHIPIRKFERPILKARIRTAGIGAITVFVAHLKSKRPKFLPGEDPLDPGVLAMGQIRSLIVRAAEAAALRALVVAASRATVGTEPNPVVVIGDLNDDLDAVTTDVVKGSLNYLPSDNPNAPQVFAASLDVLLMSAVDLASERPERLYSYVHQNKGAIIDHILLSEEFFANAPVRRADVTTLRIINSHLRRIEPGPARPPEAPDPARPPRPRRVSLKTDHGIPVVTIVPRTAPQT